MVTFFHTTTLCLVKNETEIALIENLPVSFYKQQEVVLAHVWRLHRAGRSGCWWQEHISMYYDWELQQYLDDEKNIEKYKEHPC